MAYSSDDLTAAEIAGFAADKSLFVVQQIDEGGTVASRFNTGGTIASSDTTAGITPASRAHDNIGSLVAQSTGVASTTPKYFNLTFSTAITFDTLLILGHNFNSANLTSVSLEIANNTGVVAVIQPGGSIKDQLSIDYCDNNNMAMVMTGTRHFKH